MCAQRRLYRRKRVRFYKYWRHARLRGNKARGVTRSVTRSGVLFYIQPVAEAIGQGYTSPQAQGPVPTSGSEPTMHTREEEIAREGESEGLHRADPASVAPE